MLDVLIIGGGPAGLSAALLLGRCRRNVLICDTGKPRNAAARSMHNFLSREGISPREFLALAHAELTAFDHVHYEKVEVTGAQREGKNFVAFTADGRSIRARKLLIASGVVDELPDIPKILDFYGTSIHHCPYCDAYEWRDAPVAVYGSGKSGGGLCCELIAWTSDLVLCTDGPADLDDESRGQLELLGISVYEQRIERLHGEGGKLRGIEFADGQTIDRQAMFFQGEQRGHCNIAEKLGCDFTEKGAVWTGDSEATNVPGLYCAGDASRNAQFVIVAAAEGAQAAAAINKALTWESISAVAAQR